MIIVGVGDWTASRGPILRSDCSSCGRRTVLHLVKRRRWLFLFSIPVLPLGKRRWQLVCEECGVGAGVTKGTAALGKRVVDTLEAVGDGDRDPDDYAVAAETFCETVDDRIIAAPEPAEQPESSRGFE